MFCDLARPAIHNEPEIWIRNNLVEKLFIVIACAWLHSTHIFQQLTCSATQWHACCSPPPLKCNKMQILQFSILNTQFAVNSFPFDARGHQQISSQGIFFTESRERQNHFQFSSPEHQQRWAQFQQTPDGFGLAVMWAIYLYRDSELLLISKKKA